MMRKFTAIPGRGIFAGSKVANRRRVMAAEDKAVNSDWSIDEVLNWGFLDITGGVYDDQMFEYEGQLYDCFQISSIAAGLDKHLDVGAYIDPTFDWMQIDKICDGLEEGLDVSIYADPRYNDRQMQEIMQGLEHKIDVSIYADPQLSAGQMYWIREGLERNLDMRPYAHPDVSEAAMKSAMRELEETAYNTSKLPERVQQMIRDAVNNQPNDGTQSYMTMLNNNVIEVASQDLDMYQYKTLDAVAQAATDNGLDLNNPDELVEAIYEANSFEEASLYSAHDIDDMLIIVKEMRKRYRGTSKPIYMKDEYNLND